MVEPYYKEKNAQIWKDRVLRRDRKLEKMEDRLGRLEALMEKKGTEDGRDSKRTGKRYNRSEGSKEVDSANLKRQSAIQPSGSSYERRPSVVVY